MFSALLLGGRAEVTPLGLGGGGLSGCMGDTKPSLMGNFEGHFNGVNMSPQSSYVELLTPSNSEWDLFGFRVVKDGIS